MPSKSTVVAAIQMNSNDDVQANLERAKKLASQAAKEGANLLVFPENFLCFGAASIPGLNQKLDLVLNDMGQLARDLGVGLIAGSLPFGGNESASEEVQADRFFASCVALDMHGEQVARYDKLHLFDVDVGDNVGAYRESDTYYPGSDPVVAELCGLRVGLSICYDLRFPELYQHYMRRQVDAVVIPSAFTYTTGKAHWSVLIRARAIETQSYVIAPNQCGLHSRGRETWGHSMIVGPWGEVLAECGASEGFCVAEIETAKLKKIRSDMPLLSHKRLV